VTVTRKTATAEPAPARRGPPLAPPPEREPGIGAGTAAAVFLALAVIYFLPAFMPGKQIYGSDFINAGYFFQDYISRRFSAGELPRWVPYVYGGVPYFANPGSAYYPVRFVADWLMPVKNILPAIFVFQFFVAGWGMYLLARELGCRAWVAFVGGLAFQWTGLMTSWVFAGHDGRVIVGSLVPLFFFGLHRGIRTGRPAPFAAAAAALGFALLSFQIQVAWYMLFGGLFWAVFSLAHLGTFRDRPRLARVVAMGVGAVAFGFAMGAVNFIPFNQYVAFSPRAGVEGRGYEYSVSYSMPAANVVGMAVPEQVGSSVFDPTSGETPFPAYHGPNGFKLHAEYVGATVLVLLALGLAYARRDRYWLFFAGSGLFFLTMALGGNTPLYRLYWAVLPGLKKFRAPDLAFVMVSFAVAAMAVLALEALARAREAHAGRKASSGEKVRLDLVPMIGGAVVAISFLGAVALGSHPYSPGEPSAAPGWMRFALFAAAVTVALWLWSSRRMGSVAAMAVLALLTTADLWIVGKKFFYTVPGPGEAFAEDEIAAFLRSRPGPFRVWPVPGGSAWPQQIDYPMLFGIDQAGGEHGNQIQRYVEYVGPGPGTTPSYDNLKQEPRFLVADNVRYVVISQEIAAPGFREVYRGQSALVYENTRARGRAFLVGEAIPARAEETLALMRSPRWDPMRNAVVETARPLALAGPGLKGVAAVTAYAPERVEVATQADGAALLVLADNYYPGWNASVDGRPAEVYRTNHTFRGVVVPAGRHRVVFTFDPAGVKEGLYIWLACLALLAGYGAWLLVDRRRRRAAPGTEPVPEG
jgi:hypothetical protein